MNEHTPTPWYSPENSQCAITAKSCQGQELFTEECDPEDVGEAIVQEVWGRTPDEADENAAFVIHAVNCHDELLAACNLLEYWLGEIQLENVFPEKMTGTAFTLLQRDLDWARQAIAKAKKSCPGQ
jgi:hypothetical protein